MPNQDFSRQKSLFHLLLTCARRMNMNPSVHKVEISKSLKTIEVNKDSEHYSISVIHRGTLRSVQVPVSNFKFYNTQNDSNIGKQNQGNAIDILQTLYPELGQNRLQSQLKTNKILNTEILNYIAIVLIFVVNLQNLSVSKISLIGLVFLFIPFWQIASNSNYASRLLGGIIFLSVSLVFMNESTTKSFWLFESLILGCYINYRSTNRLNSIIKGCLLFFALGSSFYSFGPKVFVLSCVFGFIEFLISIMFKKSKLGGTIAATLLIVIILVGEICILLSRYFTIAGVISILLVSGLTLFGNLTANSRAGFMRVPLSLSIFVSGYSFNGLMLVVGFLSAITFAKLSTPYFDHKKGI